MQVKNSQISKLFNQIKLRDDFILNASSELKKKNVKMKASNDMIKSIDDLEVEPISTSLPKIYINPKRSSTTSIEREPNVNKNNKKQLNLPNINVNMQREIAPHRMFNYELYKNPLKRQ